MRCGTDRRLHGKDAIARVHIINILSRFNLPEVQTAVVAQLKIRTSSSAAPPWMPCARWTKSSMCSGLCALLRDPEIDVQNKAVDVVIKQPSGYRPLPDDVLKDENEYARRSAVEVLNEIGNAGSVKYLVQALKDSDCGCKAAQRTRSARSVGRRSSTRPAAGAGQG